MDEHRIGQDGGDTHEPLEPETRRATGMGEPGTFPEDRDPLVRARRAASGKLEETADRVRQMGDRVAARNQILGRARPLVYNAADGIDGAADYVRSHELNEMRSDFETQIRRHPLAAIGVAFLAGYTLRRLF
jgi:hypothetical protein